MNLQCKRARLPLAALGVTALVAGAGALSTPAFAADALAISPSTTSFTTINLGDVIGGGTTLAQALADATYAIDVTTPAVNSTNGFRLMLDSFAPSVTGATPADTPTLYYGRQAAGAATGPATGWGKLTLTTPGTTDMTGDLQNPTYDTFFTGNEPGTYKFHFFDTAGTPGTDDDKSSGPITMTVADVTAQSTATTDDWKPAVTAPATAGIGDPVNAKVSLAPATLTDARGSSSGNGVLGSQLNQLVGIGFTGAATAAPARGTYNGTAASRTLAVGQTSAGTLTTTATFDAAGNGIGAGDTTLNTATTTVSSNGVTGLTDFKAKTVDGSVISPSATTVTAKPSATAVTYTAKVANSGTATDVAGKTVYFTVGGTATAVGKITTDGTAVDTTSTTSHVYSAKTDDTGMASLTVTFAGAANNDTYTVGAASNGQPVAANTITTTYKTAAPTKVEVTSTASDLTVSAGDTVTVKGDITDQYGAKFTPASNFSQQASLFASAAGTNCTPPAATGTPTANATLSGGSFSFTYKPDTAPTAGQCIGVTIGYDLDNSGSIGAGETTAAQINYSSTTAASTITLTTPTQGQQVDLQDHTAPTSAATVTGTATDAGGQAVAYTEVNLAGGAGVYFSTTGTPTTAASDDLSRKLTVVTNASGQYTAYVFYTDSGSHKITAKAGDASKSVDVTVVGDSSTNPVTTGAVDPYRITVSDVTGQPGDTLFFIGTVTDMFGNPVEGAEVGLTYDDNPSVGNFLIQSSLTTGTSGKFSATFATGANSSGKLKVTATLLNNGTPLTTNPTPAPEWKANAGLDFEDGVFQDAADILVTDAGVTLSAPDKVTAGANGAVFKIKGTFLPETSVDVYGKVSGDSVYRLMGTKQTDADGKYFFDVKPVKSTTYLAKSSGLSSGAEKVIVYSKVSLTAKAMGKGKVKLTANGDPNGKAPLRFYRSKAGADPRLASITSSSSGVGSVTVTLPKGTQKVYATFDASGTNMGTSKIVSVKVK